MSDEALDHDEPHKGNIAQRLRRSAEAAGGSPQSRLKATSEAGVRRGYIEREGSIAPASQKM